MNSYEIKYSLIVLTYEIQLKSERVVNGYVYREIENKIFIK